MSFQKRAFMPIAILISSLSFSQEETSEVNQKQYEKRVYTTASIVGKGEITIDGKIDEEAWNVVEWSSDYVEFEPDVGTAPTEQTKLKIAYDDKNLYVAFKCYEKDPSTIERRMGRRDDFPGDWVELNIDSYNDDRTGFSFTISASGVKGDEFVSNNGNNWDSSWNPIWYVDTQIDAEGWTAEMRIPLSQLRFGNNEEQVWGLQSTRRYFKNEERSLWQPVPANPPGWVSEFGELRGLIGLKPQKQLEIQPYTVAQLDTYEAEPGNPYRDRTPQGSAYGEGAEFADDPINTTILGAAKLSGKTKDGWTLGILESVTANEYADFTDEDGNEDEVLVEPLTNYFVGRVQKDFNDRNSYVGGIFTATTRNMADNLQFLHSHAYSGGLDFQHNWKDRKYYVEGSSVISNVRGSAEAITNTQYSLTHLFHRVDASHVEIDPNKTSLTGTGGRFEIGKGSGGNWRYNFGGNWRSPELELNDLGFLRQADEIRQYANVRRFWNTPTSWFRQANVGLNQFSSYDFEGNYNRIQYEVNGYVNWKNNWWTEGGAAHKPRIFSNTVLRGGPRWRWSDENYFFLFAGTDSRKKFNMHVGHVNSWSQQQNFALQRYVLRFFYQPLNTLSLSLITEYEQNPNKTQYVTERSFNGTPRYVLGKIDNESLSTTLRVNYNINPNLTIQYYGQPFIFNAKYSNFNYVNNPIAEDLNDRVTWYDNNQISFEEGVYNVDEDKDGTTDYSFGDPNFSFVQFRSNLVVRWEYIPGSEIFLVWSQGITGIGDPNNNFNTIIDNQLLSQRPQNTFLIKATYRFVL